MKFQHKPSYNADIIYIIFLFSISVHFSYFVKMLCQFLKGTLKKFVICKYVEFFLRMPSKSISIKGKYNWHI
jgi:hypothetical protein